HRTKAVALLDGEPCRLLCLFQRRLVLFGPRGGHFAGRSVGSASTIILSVNIRLKATLLSRRLVTRRVGRLGVGLPQLGHLAVKQEALVLGLRGFGSVEGGFGIVRLVVLGFLLADLQDTVDGILERALFQPRDARIGPFYSIVGGRYCCK